jgi:hypothetical protein
VRKLLWILTLVLLLIPFSSGLSVAASESTSDDTVVEMLAAGMGAIDPATGLYAGHKTLNGAIWDYFPDTGASGTGVFDTYLAIGGPDVIRGFNTGGSVANYNEADSKTSALPLNKVPIVTINNTLYREFVVDINQVPNTPLLSTEVLQIWQSTSANLDGKYGTLTNPGSNKPVYQMSPDYKFSITEPVLIYDLDGGGTNRTVILDYRVNNGSGKPDYKVYIPNNLFNSKEFVIMVLVHGNVNPNNDGFEEWGVRLTDPRGCLTISKAFQGYPEGTTLAEVTVDITGPNSYTNTLVLNLSNNWTIEICGLVPGSYTAVERDLPGWITTNSTSPGIVTAGGSTTITITNDYDLVDVPFMKVWVGGPEPTEGSITATLYQDGTAIDTLDLTAPDWAGSFDDLDKYDDMTLLPYVYTVGLEEADIAAIWDLTGPVMNDQGVWVFTNTMAYHDETAWGYLDGYAIPINTLVKNANWGWTNGPLNTTDSAIEIDLYAGAGGNILENGELVGTVTVSFAGGNIIVVYDTSSSGSEILETHLWVGVTPLPTSKNGKTVSAPGQFPKLGTMTVNSDQQVTYVIPYSGETFYIAAHAVVRIPGME